MKPSLRHAILLVGSLLSALVSGCGGGDGTPANPLVSTPKQFDSLEFTVSATKALYPSGQPIPVTFTVKNTGTQTISLATGVCDDYRIMVFQVQGQTVTRSLWEDPPRHGGCALHELKIVPNQIVTFRSTWNQQILQNANVPGGMYQIKATLTASTLSDGKATLPANALTSNPINVQINGPCEGDPALAVPGEVLVGVRSEDDGEQIKTFLSKFGSIVSTNATLHTYEIKLNAGACINPTLAQLKPRPEVAYAEPNGLIRIDD